MELLRIIAKGNTIALIQVLFCRYNLVTRNFGSTGDFVIFPGDMQPEKINFGKKWKEKH